MTWNYRIMRHGAGEAANDEPFYAIHEVHYDEGGAVNGWTEAPVGCSGETVDELSRDIAWYLTALVKPVLDAGTGREIEPAQMLEDELYAMLDDPQAEQLRLAVRNRGRAASAMSASGQDPKGLEAKPASAVRDSGDAP